MDTGKGGEVPGMVQQTFKGCAKMTTRITVEFEVETNDPIEPDSVVVNIDDTTGRIIFMDEFGGCLADGRDVTSCSVIASD